MRRRHILVALAAAALVAAPALADPGAAEEARFYDWVRTFWPIVLLAATLTLSGVLAGLSIRFVTAARFEALRDRVDKLEDGCAAREIRLSALEKAIDASPTRVELQEDIGELSERMRGVEVGVRAIDGRLETQNQYLNMLLDKGMKG